MPRRDRSAVPASAHPVATRAALLLALPAALLTLLLAAPGLLRAELPAHTDPSAWVHVQVLAINDFHGSLDSRREQGRPVGGAAVLAAYLEQAAAQAPGRTIIVHAGDLVGASPPDSALLEDEPTISFLNLLANAHCTRADRMDPACNVVGTLGNHEFDEGVPELLRLLHGGDSALGPFLESPWRGARYPTVSANVLDAATGKPLLAPYAIKRVGGVPIAFVGAVLHETPNMVIPTGVAGVRFEDEAEAINAQVRALRAQGVHAFVALIHQGTLQGPFEGPTSDVPNTTLHGPIVDIVRRLDDDVDVVISGHTHAFTNALVPNARGTPILVTQAFSRGAAFAQVELAIEPTTRDVVEKSARIVSTWGDAGPGRHPEPAVAALVAAADAAVAGRVKQAVGTAAAPIPRRENDAGESALGDLIADAQRAAMHTDMAFTNPGGIRAALAAGPVTWGDLFTVQPFGNDLVSLELTGAQVLRLLEQQWQGQEHPRILQISGLHYTWSGKAPIGHRVVEAWDASGQALDPSRTYRVTVNSFLAAGGDRFTVLTEGSGRSVGGSDLDALVDYLHALPQPFRARTDGRIVRRD
jgi:5'-nucleotidase